ncbi:MAG: DUF945 family protein, partial [Gammaproteobacteria bacterium]|nr:DUF945 family protein [Gammaproteobacteria bacterium]
EYINYFNTLPVNYSWPVSVKWQGLSGNVNFSLKNGQITRVTTQSSSTPLSIAYGPNLFTLSGLNTESDMTYNTLKLWDGSQGLSISEANLTSDNLKYSLYNFHHSSHFITQMPNDYNFTSQWNISQIVVPDLSVNSIQLDLSILNMNAKAFAELITFSRVLKNTNSSDEMIPYLLNIISPKTTLNLNFSSDTSFGDMHFGNVTLKQKIDWPANIPLPKTPEELTKNIHIHADMIVPINLVEYFFTKHFDKMPPPAVSSEPTTEGPSLGNLQNKLEQLQNNNVISTSTKIQIINILKTNPTSDGFAYFLDQLVVTNSIPKDVAESLKAQYQQIEKMTKNTAGINNSAPILPAEPKQAPTSRELALELINSYKNMGYLVQQGDNYLITVDFENEELKINGKTQIIPPTGQPEASQSVANQPVESQPAGQPMTNQPVANQPAASQPAAGGQSMPNQPAANQPVVSEPVTNQPMANQPVENQPATNNPVASQPAVNISH